MERSCKISNTEKNEITHLARYSRCPRVKARNYPRFQKLFCRHDSYEDKILISCTGWCQAGVIVLPPITKKNGTIQQPKTRDNRKSCYHKKHTSNDKTKQKSHFGTTTGNNASLLASHDHTQAAGTYPRFCTHISNKL